ncbi:TadE/TadG family type IV pilus assembly protein, partial [Rhizobium ruizarguesonis]
MLTFPIVMLVFATFIEFGYAMAQWNQTVKALQYGARLAAVSDPLTTNFNAVFPIEATDPLNNGKAAPNDATISSTCGPALANCT